MATDTSKATLGDLYRRCNSMLNTRLTAADMAAGDGGPHWDTYEFIDQVNVLAREMSGITEYLTRYYIVRSDVGLMRYIKYTREDESAGILRIDLDGQTATLPSGTDDGDCIGGQYEKICDGDGVDFIYSGHSANNTIPDTFPKIYLPAECDIDPDNYDPTANIARIKSASGTANEPNTTNILDIEYCGWGTGDPTDTDNFPTTADESSYFIPPWLIAGMMLVEYTTGTNGAIPRSADAFLNDTWATILGITVDGNASMGATTTFTIDGVLYTASITGAGAYTPDGVTNFVLIITGGASADGYTINLTHTPWQTVVEESALFTPMFETSNQDHAWYLKFDDQRIKLPDDIETIEWVMKIPKESYYDDVQVDADDANELKSFGDNVLAHYNPLDYVNHYYPVTQTMFSRAKSENILGLISENYAGLYMQIGQQLRIEPKTTDPILIMAKCRPDLADPTLTIDEFDDVYLEVPAIAIDCIQYRMLSDYFLGRAGDAAASREWYGRYQIALVELKSLFKGKMGQSNDGSPLANRLYPKRSSRSFGYSLIPDPSKRYGE